MGVGDQRRVPVALPLEKTRYSLYRRLGRFQGRSRRVRKTSPLPGFDSRKVEPIASHYTEWTNSAHTHRHKNLTY